MGELRRDFLTQLARRITGEAAPVRPVLPTFFGPVSGSPFTPMQGIEESAIEQAPRPRRDSEQAARPQTSAIGDQAGQRAPATPVTARPHNTDNEQSRPAKAADGGLRPETAPVRRWAAEPRPIAAPPPAIPAMQVPMAASTRRRESRGSTSNSPASPPENIVSVNIARVDVRAVFPSPAPAPPVRKSESKPPLALSEYLRERNGA